MELGNQKNQQKLEIEVDEKAADGTYSNLVLTAHSPSEFILDFARLMPGMPKAKVASRVIMTPLHAKSFMLSLKENVENYEKKFGEIKSMKPSIGDNLNFRFDSM